MIDDFLPSETDISYSKQISMPEQTGLRRKISGGNTICRSMNSNATNADTSSSNWSSVLIKTRATHALHAKTRIPVDRCLPFPATLPNPSEAPQDFPPPALLRGDSPELDFHGREPCFFVRNTLRPFVSYAVLGGFVLCLTAKSGKETTLWALAGYY